MARWLSKLAAVGLAQLAGAEAVRENPFVFVIAGSEVKPTPTATPVAACDGDALEIRFQFAAGTKTVGVEGASLRVSDSDSGNSTELSLDGALGHAVADGSQVLVRLTVGGGSGFSQLRQRCLDIGGCTHVAFAPAAGPLSTPVAMGHLNLRVHECERRPEAEAAAETGPDGRHLQQTTPTCPLGCGLEVTVSDNWDPENDPHPFEAGMGMYARDEACTGPCGDFCDRPYNQVLGTGRIVWHQSNCGWAVEEMVAETLTPVTPVVCMDDVAAANSALAQTGDDYDANACVTGEAAGLCTNLMFQMACAATCSMSPPQCVSDYQAAVVQWLNMMSRAADATTATGAATPGAACTVALGAQTCAQAGVLLQTLCPVTCAGARRLMDQEPWAGAGAFRRLLRATVPATRRAARRLGFEEAGQTFTITGISVGFTAVVTTSAAHGFVDGQQVTIAGVTVMASLSASLNTMHRVTTVAGQPQQFVIQVDTTGQQLATGPNLGTAKGTWYPYLETMYTWNPTKLPGSTEVCGDAAVAATTDAAEKMTRQTAADLFDVKEFHTAVSGTASMTLACPLPTVKYVHMHGKYCQYQNIDASSSANPTVVQNHCHTKCGDTTANTKNADGSYTWCHGNSVDFVEDTEALCLPREECEALCTAMDICHSIDMHRLLPRCYLNTVACAPDTHHMMDALYDVLIKVEAGDAIPDAVTGMSRVMQVTTATQYTHDELRDAYRTYTGMVCQTGEDAAAWDTMTDYSRAECEYLCSTSPGCFGFHHQPNCLANEFGELDQATCTSALGICDLVTTACADSNGAPLLERYNQASLVWDAKVAVPVTTVWQRSLLAAAVGPDLSLTQELRLPGSDVVLPEGTQLLREASFVGKGYFDLNTPRDTMGCRNNADCGTGHVCQDQVTHSAAFVSVDAATNVITTVAHSFAATDAVSFVGTSSKLMNPRYYVGDVTANSFKLYTAAARGADDVVNFMAAAEITAGTFISAFHEGLLLLDGSTCPSNHCRCVAPTAGCGMGGPCKIMDSAEMSFPSKFGRLIEEATLHFMRPQATVDFDGTQADAPVSLVRVGSTMEVNAPLATDAVAPAGAEPRSYVVWMKTTSEEDFNLLSSGTLGDNTAFNLVSVGSRGKYIGIQGGTGQQNNYYPGLLEGDLTQSAAGDTLMNNVVTHASQRVNDGRWHCVAATYDGERTQLYVDGVPTLHGNDRCGDNQMVTMNTAYLGQIVVRTAARAAADGTDASLQAQITGIDSAGTATVQFEDGTVEMDMALGETGDLLAAWCSGPQDILLYGRRLAEVLATADNLHWPGVTAPYGCTTLLNRNVNPFTCESTVADVIAGTDLTSVPDGFATTSPMSHLCPSICGYGTGVTHYLETADDAADDYVGVGDGFCVDAAGNQYRSVSFTGVGSEAACGDVMRSATRGMAAGFVYQQDGTCHIQEHAKVPLTYASAPAATVERPTAGTPSEGTGVPASADGTVDHMCYKNNVVPAYRVAGTPNCPGGMLRVLDSAMCEQARTRVTFNGAAVSGAATALTTIRDAAAPRGCWLGGDNKVYFNTHEEGALQADWDAQYLDPTGTLQSINAICKPIAYLTNYDSYADSTGVRHFFRTTGAEEFLGAANDGADLFPGTLSRFSRFDAALSATEVATACTPALVNYSHTTLGKSFVLKEAHAPCTITVAGTDVADGVYNRVEATTDPLATASIESETTYAHATDDDLRIVYAPTQTGVECDGFHIQTHAEDPAAAAGETCMDHNTVAAEYLGLTTGTRHACVWGAESGQCADHVFAGLCAMSCEPMVGDAQMVDDVGRACSSCSATGNNNWAYYNYLQVDPAFASSRPPAWTDATLSPMCAACGDATYGASWSRCNGMGAVSRVVTALCPAACAAATEGTAAVGTVPDEVSVPGAQDRRLAGHDWTHAMRTYVNGSSFFGDPLARTGAACSTAGAPVTTHLVALAGGMDLYPWAVASASAKLATVCRGNTICPELTMCVVSESRLQDEMYMWRKGSDLTTTVEFNEFLSSKPQAVRAEVMATTRFIPRGIMSASRVEVTMAADRWAYTREFARNAPGVTRVSVNNVGVTAGTLVISMADYAAADLFQTLGRRYGTTPGAQWQGWVTDVVRVERFRADGARVTDGDFEFEIYAPAATGRDLYMFRMPYSALGADALYDLTQAVRLDTEGGSVTAKAGSPGWFVVKTAKVNSDFVGALDLVECQLTADGLNYVSACGGTETRVAAVTCTEVVGAAATCACKEANGYMMQAGNCVIKPRTYGSFVQPYFLRLTHGDRLDYGLRLKEIQLYEDASCQRLVQFSQACAETTLGSGTCVTNSVTVRNGRSYPDGPTTNNLGVSNLFDAQMNSEWWSECLDCDPSETGNSAAYVEFYIRGSVAIKCVKVTQADRPSDGSVEAPESDMLSTKLILERGVVTFAGDTPQAGEVLAAWTWPETPAAQAAAPKVATFSTSCGSANTHIFAELLDNPVGHTHASSEVFGAYTPAVTSAGTPALDVPSACHCAQLCLDHVDQGCRSYKFHENHLTSGSEPKLCYLMKEPFEEATTGNWEQVVGGSAFVGWTSGRPGLRVQRIAAVADATRAFNLTLQGVAFPATTRQRVKIVEDVGATTSCYDPVPEAVSGLTCVRTVRVVTGDKDYYTSGPTRVGHTAFDQTMPYEGTGGRERVDYTICSPKPSMQSTTEVSWAGIRIAAQAMEKRYRVCYCSGKNCAEVQRSPWTNPDSTGRYMPTWMMVPGPITVAAADVTWSVYEATVASTVVTPTQAATAQIQRLSETVTLRLMAGAGSFDDVEGFAVKIVPVEFGCLVTSDATLFSCNSGTPAGFCSSVTSGNAMAAAVSARVAQWTVQVDSTYAAVGNYVVCVRTGDDKPFEQVYSSGGSATLALLPEEQDHTHPRGPFANQRYTALAGASSTINVTGHNLLSPSGAKIALSKHASGVCGNNSLFEFTPENDRYPFSAVDESVTREDAITLTLADNHPFAVGQSVMLRGLQYHPTYNLPSLAGLADGAVDIGLEFDTHLYATASGTNMGDLLKSMVDSAGAFDLPFTYTGTDFKSHDETITYQHRVYCISCTGTVAESIVTTPVDGQRYGLQVGIFATTGHTIANEEYVVGTASSTFTVDDGTLMLKNVQRWHPAMDVFVRHQTAQYVPERLIGTMTTGNGDFHYTQTVVLDAHRDSTGRATKLTVDVDVSDFVNRATPRGDMTVEGVDDFAAPTLDVMASFPAPRFIADSEFQGGTGGMADVTNQGGPIMLVFNEVVQAGTDDELLVCSDGCNAGVLHVLGVSDVDGDSEFEFTIAGQIPSWVVNGADFTMEGVTDGAGVFTDTVKVQTVDRTLNKIVSQEGYRGDASGIRGDSPRLLFTPPEQSPAPRCECTKKHPVSATQNNYGDGVLAAFSSAKTSTTGLEFMGNKVFLRHAGKLRPNRDEFLIGGTFDEAYNPDVEAYVKQPGTGAVGKIRWGKDFVNSRRLGVGAPSRALTPGPLGTMLVTRVSGHFTVEGGIIQVYAAAGTLTNLGAVAGTLTPTSVRHLYEGPYYLGSARGTMFMDANGNPMQWTHLVDCGEHSYTTRPESPIVKDEVYAAFGPSYTWTVATETDNIKPVVLGAEVRKSKIGAYQYSGFEITFSEQVFTQYSATEDRHKQPVVTTIQDCGMDLQCGTADDGITSSFSSLSSYDSATVNDGLRKVAATAAHVVDGWACNGEKQGTDRPYCGSLIVAPGEAGVVVDLEDNEGAVYINGDAVPAGTLLTVASQTQAKSIKLDLEVDSFLQHGQVLKSTGAFGLQTLAGDDLTVMAPFNLGASLVSMNVDPAGIHEGAYGSNNLLIDPAKSYKITLPAGLVRDNAGNMNSAAVVNVAPGVDCARKENAGMVDRIRLSTQTSLGGTATVAGFTGDAGISALEFYACDMKVNATVSSAMCRDTAGDMVACVPKAGHVTSMVDSSFTTVFTIDTANYDIQNPDDMVIIVDFPAPVPITAVAITHTVQFKNEAMTWRVSGSYKGGPWSLGSAPAGPTLPAADPFDASFTANLGTIPANSGQRRYYFDWQVAAAGTRDLRSTPEAVVMADAGARWEHGASASATGTGFSINLPAGIVSKGNRPIIDDYATALDTSSRNGGYSSANGYKYSVCYCDPSADTTLEDVGNDAVTFAVTETTKAGDVTDYIRTRVEAAAHDFMVGYAVGDYGVALPVWAMHNCHTKCSKGCTGSSCYCDDYADDYMATGTLDAAADYLLCATPDMCRQACEDHSEFGRDWSAANGMDRPETCTGVGTAAADPRCGRAAKHSKCMGIEVHATKNRCYLLTAAPEDAAAQEARAFKYIKITTAGLLRSAPAQTAVVLHGLTGADYAATTAVTQAGTGATGTVAHASDTSGTDTGVAVTVTAGRFTSAGGAISIGGADVGSGTVYDMMGQGFAEELGSNWQINEIVVESGGQALAGLKVHSGAKITDGTSAALHVAPGTDPISATVMQPGHCIWTHATGQTVAQSGYECYDGKRTGDPTACDDRGIARCPSDLAQMCAVKEAGAYVCAAACTAAQGGARPCASGAAADIATTLAQTNGPTTALFDNNLTPADRAMTITNGPSAVGEVVELVIELPIAARVTAVKISQGTAAGANAVEAISVSGSVDGTTFENAVEFRGLTAYRTGCAAGATFLTTSVGAQCHGSGVASAGKTLDGCVANAATAQSADATTCRKLCADLVWCTAYTVDLLNDGTGKCFFYTPFTLPLADRCPADSADVGGTAAGATTAFPLLLQDPFAVADQTVPAQNGGEYTGCHVKVASTTCAAVFETMNWRGMRGAPEHDLEWTRLEMKRGASCTSMEDFTMDVGVLTVTERVQTGVDYIFEVDTLGSIEVTNANGLPLFDQYSADRITVIDCYGKCGVTQPTSYVSLPAATLVLGPTTAGTVASLQSLMAGHRLYDSLPFTTAVSGTNLVVTYKEAGAVATPVKLTGDDGSTLEADVTVPGAAGRMEVQTFYAAAVASGVRYEVHSEVPGTDITKWNLFYPLTQYQEQAHIDAQNPVDLRIVNGVDRRYVGTDGVEYWRTPSYNVATFRSIATNVVETTAAHGFQTGDPITYLVGTGNAITGLTVGSVYFPAVTANNKFTLHSTAADAMAGTSQLAITGGSAAVSFAQLSTVTPVLQSAVTVRNYVVEASMVCEGNVDIHAITLKLDGVDQSLSVHGCYDKCSVNAPCEGDNCYCDGLFSGFDGPTSNALCVSENECAYLCDRVAGCTGYDMHKTLNRCFLNQAGCTKVASTTYDIYEARTVLQVGDVQATTVCPENRNAVAIQYIKFWDDVDHNFDFPRVVVCGKEITFADGLTVYYCADDAAECEAFGAEGDDLAGDMTQIVLKLPTPMAATELRLYGLPDGEDISLDVGDVELDLQVSVDGIFYSEIPVGRHSWTRLPNDPKSAVVTLPQIKAPTGAALQDYGFSQAGILRFFPMSFRSAGTFKLCFCDSASLGGASCGALADYGVEVGQIHVSGVACLLQNPKFRKSVCCRQYWPLPVESNGRTGTRGTYRCYKNLRSCPSFTITQPMDIVTTTPALVQPTSSTGMLATWCIFGPEEITQLEPNCQLVAGYQSVS